MAAEAGEETEGRAAGPEPLVARIAQDISFGRLPPGSWLKQIDLEARYGAKRLDIRQALDLLVERGLVCHVERRGYRVEEFAPERVQEIMAIRAALEAEAAGQVVERIDEASLAVMHEAALAFQSALEDGTAEEQDAANRRFHAAMLASCPNREIVRLLFALRDRVPAWIIRQRNTQALLRLSAAQHFEIIALIRQRDGAALQALMRRHNLTPP